MGSITGSFEVENWKLDIVKSHFSAEKKSKSQPALDQEGSQVNVTSTTSSAAANSSSGLDSDVTSLIKEQRGSVPVTPSFSTPKKRLDAATHEEKRLGTSSWDKPNSCTNEAHLQELSGINTSAGKWGALEDVIRPLKTESSANSRIITPIDDTDKDEILADQDQYCSNKSAKSIKPKIIKNKCQFPISLESLKGKYNDQGRNCVVVFFKSQTCHSMVERERTVLNNKKEVDKVLKKYKLKYDFSYLSQIRAVYNLCFVSPTETRKFVRDLNDFMTSLSGPKILTYFMCREEMLGYQHIPVLTENEMLTLHSPEYVNNVLSSRHDVKVVTGANDEITFVFKTVIELNVFILDHCASNTANTLGELKTKAKVTPLKLTPDENGFYRASSKASILKLKPLAEEFKFELRDVRHGVRTLCFRSKAYLFEFLLDEKISSIPYISIDKSLIIHSKEFTYVKSNESSPDPSTRGLLNEIRSSSPIQVPHKEVETPATDQVSSSIVDVENDDSESVLDDSFTTEASVYEAVLAQKDDEIRLLKSQLSHKDDLIRRKENENKKIETKLFDSQDVLTQVTKILTNNNSLHHVIPEVRESLRKNNEEAVKR